MTALKRIFIRCDRCGAFAASLGAMPKAETVVEARQLARAAGWRLDKLHRDVCPRHPRLTGTGGHA